MKYGIVLKLKRASNGLTKNDILELLNILDDTEVYPIEITSFTHEVSAIGFITKDAAEKIAYQYHPDSLLYTAMSYALDSDASTNEPTIDYDIDNTDILLITDFPKKEGE